LFIEIKDRDGEACWINPKQVLVIRLGRPTEGWVWSFSYRNSTLWSETFKTKEEAVNWLDNTLNSARVPKVSS